MPAQPHSGCAGVTLNLGTHPSYPSATMPPMERASLEQLAQTTEPQMVRARFDEQNLGWAYVVCWFFAATSFLLIPFSFMAKLLPVLHICMAVADAVLTIFMIAAMTELRRVRRRPGWEPHGYARMVGRNLAAWLITT